MCNCEEPRLGLNGMSNETDRGKIPLRVEDHSGNDPHLVPDFPHLCSGMFPERSRIASVPADSREIYRV